MRFVLLSLTFSLLFLGCDDTEYKYHDGNTLIRAQSFKGESSTAGNLITTAVKDVHDLDVVFYPAPLISNSGMAALTSSTGEDPYEQQALFDLYPVGQRDQFKLGTMSGEDIKKFVLQRSKELYDLELEVAGLKYHIHFVGGVPTVQGFTRENGYPLIDDEFYRVAISEYYFFNGTTFPGYKYRNSMNFSFTEQGKTISAVEALGTYVKRIGGYPYLGEVRAKVTKSLRGNAGTKKISEVQGAKHLSPYYGYTVTTRGVVTAAGANQWYPGGVEVYIQDPVPDAHPETSEGIKLYFENESTTFELGDYIEVSGVVYEEITETGLGSTTIREIRSHRVLNKAMPLPPSIKLGRGGLAIPDRVISTYRGNLNHKPRLDISEGIDFWESLEGMRVKINNPRVVGFRGGQEEFEELKPKSYLNLYVKPDGKIPGEQDTPRGGLIVDVEKEDYNPEIMQIITNHLTHAFDTEKVFNVGEQITGDIEGVLVYNKNLFGDGEYNLVLPIEQTVLTEFIKTLPKDAASLSDKRELDDERRRRPVTTLVADESQLTVATLNLENLAGYQETRLRKFGEMIEVSLKCPDIINFVEIQDANGQDLEGDASGEVTLKRLIGFTDCPNADYKHVNIDPVLHAEGGQPGGNIRMAMIYNSNKIGFTPKLNPDPLAEVIVTNEGDLSSNPGRIFPNEKAFKGSRRSLVTEFRFKSEKIFVIGNHFNSKLGDRSRWSALQPPSMDSDNRRAQMADKINDFVQILKLRSPRSHVLVVGDFNALLGESSMNVLESEHLKNLLGLLLPPNERYTANYNGSSQALDHIFVGHSLLSKNPEVEVLNLNSDFMGRVSDHDPVITRLQF